MAEFLGFSDETGNLQHTPGDRHALAIILFSNPDRDRIRQIAEEYSARVPLDRRGKVDTERAIRETLPVVEATIDDLRLLGVSTFRHIYDCSVEDEASLRTAVLGSLEGRVSAQELVELRQGKSETGFDEETKTALGLVGAFEAMQDLLTPSDRRDFRVIGTLRKLRRLAREHPVNIVLFYSACRTFSNWLCSLGAEPRVEIHFEIGKFRRYDECVVKLLSRFAFHHTYNDFMPAQRYLRSLFGLDALSPVRTALANWRHLPELLLADLHAYLVGAVINGRGDVALHQALLDRFVKAPEQH